MIHVEGLGKRFGDRVLFEDVSWHVKKRDRIGLSGPNGSGKTTLLRMLAGLQEPDSGSIRMASDTTIGYLPQDGIVHHGRTVHEEVVLAFEQLLALKKEQHDIEERLAHATEDGDHDQLLERYAEVTDHFKHLGGYEIDARVAEVLKGLGLRPRQFVLATIHRAENTDDPSRLRQIVSAFLESQEEIIMPVHPRTRKALNALGVLPSLGKLRTLEPVGYLDMIMLESSARVVLTDSGGVQKEAYWLGVPCLTLRDETEWVETVEAGWNRLVKAETPAILAALKTVHIPSSRPVLYGDGHAAVRSVDQLLAYGRTIVSERKAKLSQQA